MTLFHAAGINFPGPGPSFEISVTNGFISFGVEIANATNQPVYNWQQSITINSALLLPLRAALHCSGAGRGF